MDPTQLIINAFDTQAEAYQDKFMHLDLYNGTYDAFLKRITRQDACILELGCGPGNITRYLLAQRPGLRILATDLAPNMVKLAALNNPAADCKVMDCRTIGQLEESFDAVLCGFCLPYLSRTEFLGLLYDCAKLLLQDGVFYFSCIEGDYSRSGYQANAAGERNFFMYYHDESSLRGMIEKTGFRITDLFRIPYPERDGSVSQHLVMIGSKIPRDGHT